MTRTVRIVCQEPSSCWRLFCLTTASFIHVDPYDVPGTCGCRHRQRRDRPAGEHGRGRDSRRCSRTPSPRNSASSTASNINGLETGRWICTTSEPIFWRYEPVSRRSILSDTVQGSGFNPYDYEKKYPEDPFCEEAGPNARVWWTYLDVAAEYDAERIDGRKDTIDLLLIFVRRSSL